MNKNKKKCILAIAGLFLLIITAASVSADEDDEPGILDRGDIIDTFDENETNDSDSITDEPNLIAPSPDNDLEPLIIAPMDTTENEEALFEDNAFTTGLILVVGISGIAGLAVALVIFKK